jgi:hypothetical protein
MLFLTAVIAGGDEAGFLNAFNLGDTSVMDGDLNRAEALATFRRTTSSQSVLLMSDAGASEWIVPIGIEG